VETTISKTALALARAKGMLRLYQRAPFKMVLILVQMLKKPKLDFYVITITKISRIIIRFKLKDRVQTLKKESIESQ
jgi:hypothetical protein